MNHEKPGIDSPARVRPFRKAMRNLEHEIEKALSAQTGCCGVSSAQCHLLLEIAEAGAGNIGDFAERLDLDISTLSRGVDSLVKAGLATRKTDTANRRKQIVDLSHEGLAKVTIIHEICDAYYLKLLGTLPPDLQAATVQAVPLLVAAMRQARTDTRDGPCTCTSGEMQS
jgi:DNA-binding MarR family transcriptional regulator